MRIQCLGLSHQTAPLGLLERASMDDHSLAEALSRVSSNSQTTAGRLNPMELVILSTCNRVELYAAAPEPVFDQLEGLLLARRPAEGLALRPHMYWLADEDAISHLFKVAAGLDSLAVGEPQILGQVARALSEANEAGAAGNVLNRLFRAAISAGKRVRTETELGQQARSIPTLAARLAARLSPDLSMAEITLLGAGAMAQQTLAALRKRGGRRFVVINRTLERAQKLARRWQGAAYTLAALPEMLQQTDILIASISSPQVLVDPGLVERALRQRAGRSLLILDIAMPRAVDPQVGLLPGIRLHDLESLGRALADLHSQAELEFLRAEAILQCAQTDLLKELAALRVVPVIVELREHLERIRREELEKSLRKMKGLGPVEREHIVRMTHSIVNKFLHPPTARLRQAAVEPGMQDYLKVTRELFSLSPDLENGDPHA